MTDMVRIYINARGLDVRAGLSALDALRVWSADEADAVAHGARAITDSRGLPVSPTDLVYAGAIFRVVGGRAAGAAGRAEADDAR